MKRSTLISLIIALSFLGVADAWYLAETALTHTALTCSIAGLDGCNVVAQSPYSHVFGIPLGVYGVVFYALTIIIAALSARLVRTWLDRILALIVFVGALASLYFLYVQFVLIQALCVYCLASAVISLALTVVVIRLVRGQKTSDPAATVS
ncbi:MAG: vitamin K epoxide reductase family protein [Bacillota bacterium]